jgi:plastocyanin
MEKKRLVFTVGFVFILALTFLLAKQSTSNASECRVVRIIAFATYQNVTLDPKTSYVNKGDCVIWFNNAAKSDVKIVFEDGKKCTDIVEASTDFKLDENSCLITKTYIPYRGTASFVFDKEGSFDYLAEVKGTNLKIKGTIKVR